MANKVTKFLGNVFDGIFSSRGDMSDYQHAARLFVDDFNKLSPKVQFLYHVTFVMNNVAIRSPDASFNKAAPQIECGMLVKNVNLPGVTVQTETKNQYGKKTNFQTGVQYTPVNFTFHDDNAGVVSSMWQQYFKANYNDSMFPDHLKKQQLYTNDENFVKFGLNSDRSVRFFNEISIYQLARHQFFEFTLINPIVTQWEAPRLDNSSSQPTENSMGVIYEGIRYSTGRVSQDNPAGFAQLHYDKSPSPLSIMGGGGGGLFGATGVLAGGLDVFGDVQSGVLTSGDPFAILGTAIKAKNTFDNARNLTSEGVRQEVAGIAEKTLTNTVQNEFSSRASTKFDLHKVTVAGEGSTRPENIVKQQTSNSNNNSDTTTI